MKKRKEKYNFEGTCLDEYSAPAGRRLNLFNLFSIEFLDFKGGVKLFWTNKAIVININLIEFIKSGDVVCCHDCLFQADQPILIQVKPKKVFHGRYVQQVVVEVAISFNHSCRN